MTHDRAPLSAAEIDRLSGQMTALRAQLQAQEQESQTARATVDLDQQSVGRLSRMDAIQQQAMAEAEARRRQADLSRIEAALRRIAEGEYGWCDECGEPIGEPRLAVDPMAVRCIACAD